MSQSSVSVEKLIPISVSLLKVGDSLPYDLYNSKGKFISAKSYIFKNEMEISMISHAKPMRLRTAADNENNNQSESVSPATSEVVHSPIEAKTSIDYGGGQRLPAKEREYELKDRKPNLADETNEGKKDAVVSVINELINLFPSLYDTFNDDSQNALRLLKDMETKLFQVIELDRDAAIGVIHISEIKSQAEHCVFSAILAAIYSQTIGYPKRFVRLVATSAFCMNLGAIKLHNDLNSKNSDLSDGLLSEIRKHSEASVALMAKAGIRHPTINNAILHHHERPDGEGYPLGLHSQEIPDEALIIGIVDTYLAMIGPRAYRTEIPPKEALKRVLFEGHKYDNDFYTTFIKAIGVYPAGTFHELSNGEVVIVKRRDPAHATKPEVCTLIDTNGNNLTNFKSKRLSESNQTIKAPFPGGRALQINPLKLWS